MGVHTRERICTACGRWHAHERTSYLLQDQFESRHQYPLCPSCHSLGTLLALWMHEVYDPSVVVEGIKVILAMLAEKQIRWEKRKESVNNG